MEKIDRLGWAGGVAFEAFGLTVGVRVTDPAATAALADVLPWGARRTRRRCVDYLYSWVVAAPPGTPGGRRFHVVYADLAELVRTRELPVALEALEHSISLVVGERARGWVFVHAGVVGYNGRALLLPGRSFSGKTTLVEALVRAGARYYSDEFAVLDGEGRVHPFARPLGRRVAGEWKGRPVPIAEVGGVAGEEPLPVGAVVCTQYRAGGRARWRRLSAGQGVLALMENALAARSRPAMVLPVLQRVAQTAVVIKGPRGEAEEVVPRLLSLL